MSRPQLFQNTEAIESGQTDIENDQVERVLLSAANCFLAVVSHHGIVPGLDQRGRNMPRNPGFIINNENTHALESRLAAQHERNRWANDQGKVTRTLLWAKATEVKETFH